MSEHGAKKLPTLGDACDWLEFQRKTKAEADRLGVLQHLLAQPAGNLSQATTQRVRNIKSSILDACGKAAITKIRGHAEPETMALHELYAFLSQQFGSASRPQQQIRAATLKKKVWNGVDSITAYLAEIRSEMENLPSFYKAEEITALVLEHAKESCRGLRGVISRLIEDGVDDWETVCSRLENKHAILSAESAQKKEGMVAVTRGRRRRAEAKEDDTTEDEDDDDEEDGGGPAKKKKKDGGVFFTKSGFVAYKKRLRKQWQKEEADKKEKEEKTVAVAAKGGSNNHHGGGNQGGSHGGGKSQGKAWKPSGKGGNYQHGYNRGGGSYKGHSGGGYHGKGYYNHDCKGGGWEQPGKGKHQYNKGYYGGKSGKSGAYMGWSEQQWPDAEQQWHYWG
jgi:hypothetical protein